MKKFKVSIISKKSKEIEELAEFLSSSFEVAIFQKLKKIEFDSLSSERVEVICKDDLVLDCDVLIIRATGKNYRTIRIITELAQERGILIIDGIDRFRSLSHLKSLTGMIGREKLKYIPTYIAYSKVTAQTFVRRFFDKNLEK